MEGTGDNIVLLFLGELDEVYRITRYSYSQLRVLLGVSLCIEQSLTGENIYVKMVSAFLNIAVKQLNKIVYLLFIRCSV